MSDSTDLPNGERYLRVRQILEILPVSRGQFYILVAQGKLPKPVARVGNRCTLYRESEVRAAVEKLIAENPAEVEGA